MIALDRSYEEFHFASFFYVFLFGCLLCVSCGDIFWIYILHWWRWLSKSGIESNSLNSLSFILNIVFVAMPSKNGICAEMRTPSIFFVLFFLVPYYYCYSSLSFKVQFVSRFVSIHLEPPMAAPIGDWTFAWSFCFISFLFHFIRSIENSFCCQIDFFFLSRTEILPKKKITSPKKFQS